MLNPALIERLHECASIRRWNDHVRPVEFTELDKQAHKMIIAYVLAKFEETDAPGSCIDWARLVDGGVFELLYRIILTDIKPPVFHRMMREKGPELNRWVLTRLEPEIRGIRGGFAEAFRAYLCDEQYAAPEKRILKAAHYLATQWEFNIIYNVCPFVYGIDTTKAEIENQLEDYYDLKGVQKIALGRKVFGFVDLCGQLRFQRRWSQSPRIPETSVLGHMLIVAILTSFCLRQLGACPRRLVNGFFAGLLHDLPEVLTRDITSPVKNAVEGLDGILKEYETIQMEQKLLPLLPRSWHAEIKYYVENEFSNRAVDDDGCVRAGLTVEDLNDRFNHDAADPVDGELIRACDHLAAFIEAALSIRHGITSTHLQDGRDRLWSKYRDCVIAGIDFGTVFQAFLGAAPRSDQPCGAAPSA